MSWAEIGVVNTREALSRAYVAGVDLVNSSMKKDGADSMCEKLRAAIQEEEPK